MKRSGVSPVAGVALVRDGFTKFFGAAALLAFIEFARNFGAGTGLHEFGHKVSIEES
jgi:hypothetical protein